MERTKSRNVEATRINRNILSNSLSHSFSSNLRPVTKRSNSTNLASSIWTRELQPHRTIKRWRMNLNSNNQLIICKRSHRIIEVLFLQGKINKLPSNNNFHLYYNKTTCKAKTWILRANFHLIKCIEWSFGLEMICGYMITLCWPGPWEMPDHRPK